ncbi:MAG TPA: helix-turn-helix domain-containing protein [Burkholderiales bacterium]|nr:helix-turn-helix domain-containing protein [Burkholderiales bacterium]
MTELGVGKALAEAREAQGLTLADVAQQLKFMPRQIESLEAERFELLPGPTIARGMVRTYARFLKIDPEPLLQSMTGRVDAPDATPQLAARFNQPVPFSDNGRRSTVLYLALSAAVLALAGGLLYQWRHERKAPALVASAPAPTPAPKAGAKSKPPPAPEEKIAEPTPPAPEPVAPPPTPKPAPVAQPAPKPAPVKEPVPAREPAQPKVAAIDPPAPKPAAGPNRLVLRFEQDAWAEVTDAAGRNLVSSLNLAGTERVVRGAPPFNLVIGNAQHVKVIYNNREIDLQPYVKVEVARFTIK